MSEDQLVMASAEPKVGELVADFQRCSPFRNGWNRLEFNEQVRDATWEGQSADGKKHALNAETPAFPFEGASDMRVFTVDGICNENVALCTLGFFRAMVRFAGVEAKDGEAAGDATRFMEWLMQSRNFGELLTEVELSAQMTQEMGLCVLHPFWEREAALELRRITVKELAQAAGLGSGDLGVQSGELGGGVQMSGVQGGPPEGGTTYGGGSPGTSRPTPNADALKLLTLALKPELEEEAVTFVTEVGREIVMEEFAEFLEGADCVAIEGWEISPARARAFVRGLREEGCGELPLPMVLKNQPAVAALRPWDEVFFRGHTTDLAKQSRVYRREFLEEVELRVRGAMKGWDSDWVEAAVKTKGRVSAWSGSSWSAAAGSGDWQGNGSWAAYNDRQELIEVLYAFRRCVDEDGVQSFWLTTFSAHCGADDGQELCAAHEQVSGDEMGFVMCCRERRSRGVARTRGVPELAGALQRTVKNNWDALNDLLSLAVLPPLNIPDTSMKTKYRFGPAVQNTVRRGFEPEFMDIPTKGAPLSMEAIAQAERDADIMFGRDRADVAPTRTAAVKQMMLNSFLGAWSVALQRLWGLSVRFTSASEFERITGGAKPSREAARRGEDLILHFDVRDLDMEHVQAQYAAFKDLVTMDAGGVIDKGRLVELMARAINPSIAREAIVPKAGASQQLYRKVQQDLALMILGMEPEYSEDADPSAATQLQYANQIFSQNPKFKRAAGQDADFQARMKKYLDSLEFNVQQGENKVVGRIGVTKEVQS